MSGWFAMSRAMFEHPIFKGKPERVAAWAWILATAAWKPVKMDANGKTVEVQRGQLLTSYRQMSEATGVSVKALRILISRLEGEHAIDTDMGTGRMLITIRNYEKYQDAGHSEGTPKGTGRAQEGHTKEQDNNSAKAESANAPSDPAKAMFDAGVSILGASGMNPQKARQMVGKWRKEHSEEAVIVALGRCQREGAIDPVGFIEGCLRFHRGQEQKRKSHPEIGDERIVQGVLKRYAGNGVGWITSHG